MHLWSMQITIRQDEKVIYGRNLFSLLGAYLELVPAGNFYSHMLQHLTHQGSRMLGNISFLCIFTKSAASLCHKYTSKIIMYHLKTIEIPPEMFCFIYRQATYFATSLPALLCFKDFEQLWIKWLKWFLGRTQSFSPQWYHLVHC